MTFLPLPPSAGMTGAHPHSGNIFFKKIYYYDYYFVFITKKTRNQWGYSQGYTYQQMKLGF